MLANNPFVNITSSMDDKVVDRSDEKVELQMYINEVVNHGGLVILEGKPGIGKSTLINLVVGNLKKSQKLSIQRYEFTPSVYNALRDLKTSQTSKSLVIIDDFNNIEMFDKTSQMKVIDLIVSLSKNIGIVLVENRDEGVQSYLEKTGNVPQKLSLGGLKKDDMQQMIINRLASVQIKHVTGLEPFSEDEFDKIYKKSSGNPRIALLICSALYDQKQMTVI
ncbi:hypothetical protein M1139_01935 [Candidatus Parvarchaeota archaeon]|nr:hypothetical protein [Candidatus Parvarchaeota archaeon]